jgi:putative oxidoreductase
MTPALFSLVKFDQYALLFMRAGLGALIGYHGYPFFVGGTASWAEMGKAVQAVGITIHYPVFGFIAAMSLFFGGMFVVAGLFTRVWSFLIGATLAVAALNQFQSAGGFAECTHALSLAIVFLALFILGPGRYSLDEKFFG